MAFVELTCISCPLGCPLRVETDDEGRVLSVTGNTRKEVTAPTRTVTSTVRLTGGGSPVVSVRTREDIPKGKIFDVMAAIRSASVAAPVHIGDVVIPDIAGTGVDLIATAEREAV